MRSSNAKAALALVTLFGLSAATYAQEPKIGDAQSAKNQVEGIINGKSENISPGSGVYSNETVRTGKAGIANLVFLDNTKSERGELRK